MADLSAEYVVTRAQVMALAGANLDRDREKILRDILGGCDSMWKGLGCIRYDGHSGYHSSGEVNDAWASWGRTDG